MCEIEIVHTSVYIGIIVDNIDFNVKYRKNITMFIYIGNNREIIILSDFSV